MSRRSPTASRRSSPIPTCAGASGAKASGGPRSTGGRAWPRRSAASTRRSSPARPRTSRPRAATTDPRRRCATLPRTVGVLLEVENLTTEFVTRGGVVRAADDVSWDVGEGETVALVGESGCGKSVSALSIMRLVAPPAGRIVGGRVLFKGRDLLALPDEAMRQIRGREIAMIFQEPMTSLNPVLSIGRQLTEGLEIHLGITPREARQRAGELLAMVGIPDSERRLGQYPHQFSGGMRQRMMIAMALACNPSLILADEPTTALDVTIQAQILELMKDLSRRLAVAMLIITHHLGVVARYADRVNVMYAGRIVERGTARELYANPRHPYTLGLLRSVPRLDEPRRARLDPIEGQPPDLTRLPAGCAFAARCAFRVERCARDRPGLVGVGAGDHVSACWETERLDRALATRRPAGARVSRAGSVSMRLSFWGAS